jgi:hypothetical protein
MGRSKAEIEAMATQHAEEVEVGARRGGVAAAAGGRGGLWPPGFGSRALQQRARVFV